MCCYCVLLLLATATILYCYYTIQYCYYVLLLLCILYCYYVLQPRLIPLRQQHVCHFSSAIEVFWLAQRITAQLLCKQEECLKIFLTSWNDLEVK